MARLGAAEVDATTGAGLEAYRASKGIERDVSVVSGLLEHGLLPGDKALNNRLQRILELDKAFEMLDVAHRETRERMNDRELQKEVAAKTMLAFTDHIKNGNDPAQFDFTQEAPALPDVEGLEIRHNIAKRARAAALKEFWAELDEYGYGTWFEKHLKPVVVKKIDYTEDDTWQYAAIKKKRREAEKLEPVLRRINLAVAKKTILRNLHVQKPGIDKTLQEDIWDAREAINAHTYDEERFEKQRIPTHRLRLNEVPGG